MEKKEIRGEREYTVHMRDDQCGEEVTITVPPGTEEEQDAKAWELAQEKAEVWARGGDWGDEGEVVTVRYYWEDEDSTTEEMEESVDVEIEPDHDALIRAAGGDTDCDHEWTSEGEGGCDENPGVWSLGGTTLFFRRHCRKCGLIRTETCYGSQRNPGQADEVKYEMPELLGGDDE